MSDKSADSPKLKKKWGKFTDSEQEAASDLKQNPPVEEPDSVLGDETNLGLGFPGREDLEQTLTEMEQRVEEYKDKNLRLVAEMQNLRERTEREVGKAHKFGTERLLSDLLPVLDSLVRGIESAPEGEGQAAGVVQGLTLTLELLEKTLKKHGVEPIAPAVGEAFDPEQHEAMTMQTVEGEPSDKVLQVLQKGYALNGRVLRAARVVVSN